MIASLTVWWITFAVALLLTGMTGSLVVLTVPEYNRGAKRALLYLVVPATLWAWDVVVRQALWPGAAPRWWELVDVTMAVVALAGLVLALAWAMRERR